MSTNDPDDDISDVPMSEALRGVQNGGAQDNLKEEGEDSGEPASPEDATPPRREFLSVALGGAIVVAPTVIGLRVVLSPLLSSKSGGILARLTTLDSLEAGGPPQAFKVIADKTDAWTTYKDLPLGLVYAQRVAEQEVVVFSASCPHAGCAVEYRGEGANGAHYYCPCHESSFRTDGSLAPDNTQAKRGLDTLEVDQEKLERGEIWVRFQKFKAGISEKKAVS